MHDLQLVIDITLGAVALLLLVFGIYARPLRERLYMAEPLLALAAGALLGPRALGIVQLDQWGDPAVILEEAARVALGVQIFAIALRLPPGYVRAELRTLLVLLLVGMPAMMLLSAGAVWWLLSPPAVVALLIGATVAATDPVVASSIVTGQLAVRHLPERLRNLLSTEAAANDGAAHALVMLPVLLLTYASADAVGRWSTIVLLWEVAGGGLLGAAIGWAAARLLASAERHDLIEKPSFLVYSIALTFFTLSSSRLLRTQGVFAVFLCGVVFASLIRGSDRAEEENVQDALDRLITVSIFALFGTALPWDGWAQLGAPAVLLAIVVLLVRRLPVLLALRPWVAPARAVKDAAFLGWFGPIGVAAIFYSTLASRRTGDDLIFPAVSLLVCASTMAHGVTATLFTKLYARSRHRAR